MLFDTKYDLVFGIGEACSCSQTLRDCHLQFYSYPYDWLYGSDIINRVKILTDNFKDFINYEDIEETNLSNNDKKNLCKICKNTKNGICYNHDFKYDKPISDTYPEVKEKYERRAKRLIKQIENSNNVLVVYIQAPNNRHEIENEKLLEVYKILKTRFPNQKIKLLYLYCKNNFKNAEQNYISENVTKIYYDYNGYNKEVPYVVNEKKLHKLFCKFKMTKKFITLKNLIKRYFCLKNIFYNLF